jgi:hypothetical protein
VTAEQPIASKKKAAQDKTAVQRGVIVLVDLPRESTDQPENGRHRKRTAGAGRHRRDVVSLRTRSAVALVVVGSSAVTAGTAELGVIFHAIPVGALSALLPFYSGTLSLAGIVVGYLFWRRGERS